MIVEFLTHFSDDLDNLTSEVVKNSVVKVIEQAESAKTLRDIRNLKKLKGYKSAYRVRLGDYRIGLIIEGGVVQFARILHRREIYRLFP